MYIVAIRNCLSYQVIAFWSIDMIDNFLTDLLLAEVHINFCWFSQKFIIEHLHVILRQGISYMVSSFTHPLSSLKEVDMSENKFLKGIYDGEMCGRSLYFSHNFSILLSRHFSCEITLNLKKKQLCIVTWINRRAFQKIRKFQDVFCFSEWM